MGNQPSAPLDERLVKANEAWQGAILFIQGYKEAERRVNLLNLDLNSTENPAVLDLIRRQGALIRYQMKIILTIIRAYAVEIMNLVQAFDQNIQVSDCYQYDWFQGITLSSRFYAFDKPPNEMTILEYNYSTITDKNYKLIFCVCKEIVKKVATDGRIVGEDQLPELPEDDPELLEGGARIK
jgi:hypothetical protein